MKKYYIIQFENEENNAVNKYKYIYEAVEHCKLNIYSKYDVQIQGPEIVDEEFVMLEVRIPNHKADSFVAGRCLRSISDYLVHYCGFTSKKNYRLIRYIEIPKPFKEDSGHVLDASEQLSLISQIIELLKSNKPWDKEKIRNIQNILEK